MSASVVESGSFTFADTTEHQLSIDAAPGGVYAVMFDLNALPASTTLELWQWAKARSQASLQRLRYRSYAGTMDGSTDAKNPIQNFDSLPMVSDVQVKISGKRTGGSSFTATFKLYKVGLLYVEDEGTYTPASLGVEYTVKTALVPGAYYLQADTSALQAGDIVELAAEARCRTADTTRQARRIAPSGVQDGTTDAKCALKDFGALVCLTEDEYRFKLKQTAGTLRAFPWKLYRVA